MSKSLLSSIDPSISSIPQNALIIDRQGTILDTNSRWRTYCNTYGLPEQLASSGGHYFDLLPEWVAEPEPLGRALRAILYGERLSISSEFPIQGTAKGKRVFHIEAFPLLVDVTPESRKIIIAHQDAGPVIEGQHIQPFRIRNSTRKKAPRFLPICASCKSIRNDQEAWLTIERFLQQQLHVQFTHDICPDCIRQLYPQYAGALKGMTGNP